jgi:site-specific DNA recombinase
MDGVFDQFAKFERAKTAERTRRGKLRRAREGKSIPGRLPDYGFKYNAARDSYEVDENAMRVVGRIFYMVGADGMSLHAVKRALEREGVKTATGGKYWGTQVIRRFLLDDVYRPHTYEEVEELVTPEVAFRLDRSKCYGIWWFNVRRARATQITEVGPAGRNYRRQVKTTTKPKAEWIAVPVPDSGISRDVVDAAREAIRHNRSPSSAGHRFWELSGGIFYCGGCGCAMNSHTVRNRLGGGYHYYLCSTIVRHGKHACPQNRNIRADKVEPAVWEFVSGLLRDPEQLHGDLERMIELEREGLRGDPDRDAKVWLEKLTEADEMRGNYQEMAARGLITFDELGTRLEELENTRKAAVRELETLQSRWERIKELEQDKDTLLESYAAMVPEALDALSTEERRQVYKMLRLKVVARGVETFEVSGALGNVFSTLEPTSRSSATSTRAGSARRLWATTRAS